MHGLRLRTGWLLLLAAALSPGGCDDDGTPAELCGNGVDDDGDGLTDCDDGDCSPAPACAPVPEVCANAIDDDRDGDTDCDDGDCTSDPACAPVPEECANGVDDDRDHDTDCADADCAGDPACVEDCANGVDDDRDHDTDCADDDCAGDPLCVEDCANDADDDGDGATDCADADCTGEPVCLPATENCRNGVDDDGDGLADCADDDCTGSIDCVPPFEDCANGVDDDRDGATDCADTADCAAAPACAPDCNDALDSREDNDDLATATDAATVAPTDTLYAVAGDADVFAVAVCRGAVVTIDVTFLHAAGDLDLELQGTDGSRLAGSWSGDDDEQVVWSGDRLGTVYLVVGMYTPGACNTYRLRVAVDDSSCIWTEIDCGNGVDDDGDGLLDCGDAADCASDAFCLPESDCRDGLDNDADGATDCLDPGCLWTSQCTASGNDTCTAPYVLPDDPVGTWYGDTSTATADDRGSCGGDGRDAVFQLGVTARAELTADLEGSAFDTTLYLRGSDCAAGASLVCNDDVRRGEIWSSISTTLDPGTYYLFVDGFRAEDSGAYVLNIEVKVVEVCTDTVDNDADGTTDCDDLDCTTDPACLPAACAEDPHEDNDDRATAVAIATISSTEYLAVTPSDDDYWSIDVCVGAVVAVDARFRHASGDVDIYLQDSTGAELAVSNGAVDDEFLTWTSDVLGTVFLRVDRYGASPACSLYRLGVTVDRTGCP